MKYIFNYKSILILAFVLATTLTGCAKRSELQGSVITVENIPLYEENIETVQTGTVTREAEVPEEEVHIGKQDGEPNEQKKIVVHICGAVNNPGVYDLPEGSRVYEAVLAAGGYRSDADEDYVNQALVLKDSDKLVIPTLEDTSMISNPDPLGSTGFGVDSSEAEGSSSGKVNINTADVSELCTLSGIGEARARVIISYREENGPFKSIEDIMNVSGIKQASFDKIKSDICVN